MSNEFQVHNFYNESKEGLEELKAEFEHLWLNAYNRRCAYDDLPNHKTYQEWYKKWGDKCEDSNFCEEAAEHYGYEGDLYDELKRIY